MSDLSSLRPHKQKLDAGCCVSFRYMLTLCFFLKKSMLDYSSRHCADVLKSLFFLPVSHLTGLLPRRGISGCLLHVASETLHVSTTHHIKVAFVLNILPHKNCFFTRFSEQPQARWHCTHLHFSLCCICEPHFSRS
jgi:hypothetical protein